MAGPMVKDVMTSQRDDRQLRPRPGQIPRLAIEFVDLVVAIALRL
jgi:hypothetical protein